MPKFSMLIVDDSPKDAEHLKGLLIGLKVPAEITIATEAFAGLSLLKAHDYDVVFLDVEMPSISGIELYESLPQNKRPVLVLVTAHVHFAIDGFRIGAVDYLHKEVKVPQLTVALQRVFASLSVPLNLQFNSDREYSYLPTKGNVYYKVLYRDIIYIETEDNNYIKIVSRNEDILVRMTMGKMENEMPSYLRRVHQSYIVNCHFVNMVVGRSLYMTEGRLPVIQASRRGIRNMDLVKPESYGKATEQNDSTE